jgi:hypothetical protein
MGCELIVLATVLYATPDELLDPTSFGDERPVNLGGQWLIDAKKLRVIARGEAHVQTSVKDGKITQRYEANRDPTVADLSAEYLAVVRTRVRDRTVRRYEELLRLHVLPVIGNERVRSLRAGDVQSVVDTVLACRSARTAHHVYRVTSQLLAEAERWGMRPTCARHTTRLRDAAARARCPPEGRV